VLIKEGFEIPINMNLLVVIEKNVKKPVVKLQPTDAETMNYNFAEREEINYEEVSLNKVEMSDKELLTNDIYVAFVYENDKKPENISLYLINDSEQYLTFCIFGRKGTLYKFLETGILESGTKIIIGELTKEDIAQLNTLTIQGVLFNPGEEKIGKILNKELKINSLYLLNINYFKDNDFFDETAFILSVIQSEKNQQLLKKQKVESDLSEIPVKTQKTVDEKPELVEVDLHIQELVDDYKDLMPSEMLNIQLNHFRKKLEECILLNYVKKVVFIHGVGNGTLKLELRKILSHEYAHYDYQDASFQEYGFGATMVILKR
jgi:hypothetical protein